MTTVRFKWDNNKDITNQHKHGISFAEASHAFFDPYNLTLPDPDHSIYEIRFLLLGFNSTEIVVVSFTKRAKKIRVI